MIRKSLMMLALLLVPVLASGQVNTITLTRYSGGPGDAFASQVLFDTEETAQGWSYGVCHDDAFVTLIDATSGATTLTVKGGDEPDFNQINLLVGGVTQGVVTSFVGAFSLAPGVGYEILELDYSLVDDETLIGTSSELTFCDTLGSPPVASVLVIGGQSVVPDQVSGLLEIPEVVIPDLGLFCEAGTDSVSLSWDAVSPFDYYLLHRDGDFIAMLDGVETGFVDEGLVPGETYFYSLIGVVFPDPTGSAVVVEAVCDVEIIALEVLEVQGGAGFFYGGETVTLVGTGFDLGTDLQVLFGSEPGLDVAVVAGTGGTQMTVVSPATATLGTVDLTVSHSISTVVVPESFLYGFVRGDVNCDSAVDLADAQSLLSYMFTGGDAPCCFDGADSNDDGLLDAADSITTLLFLFSGGAPLPAPFPDTLPNPLDPASVGLDPTDTDSLGCP